MPLGLVLAAVVQLAAVFAAFEAEFAAPVVDLTPLPAPFLNDRAIVALAGMGAAVGQGQTGAFERLPAHAVMVFGVLAGGAQVRGHKLPGQHRTHVLVARRIEHPGGDVGQAGARCGRRPGFRGRPAAVKQVAGHGQDQQEEQSDPHIRLRMRCLRRF